MKSSPEHKALLEAALSTEPLLESLLHIQLTAMPMTRVIGTRRLSKIAFFGLVQESAKHAMLAQQYAKRVKMIYRHWGK